MEDHVIYGWDLAKEGADYSAKATYRVLADGSFELIELVVVPPLVLA